MTPKLPAHCLGFTPWNRLYPTDPLSALPTRYDTEGSSSQLWPRPPLPRVHDPKSDGTITFRGSPSMPPHPLNVRSTCTAGPPRRQSSQSDGMLMFWPRWIHMLLGSSQWLLMLPPNSVWVLSHAQLFHWLKFTLPCR